jgi:hypothetical protein
MHIFKSERNESEKKVETWESTENGRVTNVISRKLCAWLTSTFLRETNHFFVARVAGAEVAHADEPERADERRSDNNFSKTFFETPFRNPFLETPFRTPF